MEGCRLLACSPWLTQHIFLYNPGPLAQGRHHSQWAMNIQEKVPQTGPQAGLMEIILQLWSSLLKWPYLVRVMWTDTDQQRYYI